MGFLDNSSITVDAILTKYGKKKLADGNSLGISKFGLSDDGVDYKLWNEGNPGGSDKYGEAIEEMPMIEASTDMRLNMRYKLGPGEINQIVNPYLILDATEYTLKYQNEEIGAEHIIPSTGNLAGDESYIFTIIDSSNIMHRPSGKLEDPAEGHKSGLPEGGEETTVVVGPTGQLTIWAAPVMATQRTSILVEGATTGASATIRVTIEKNYK